MNNAATIKKQSVAAGLVDGIKCYKCHPFLTWKGAAIDLAIIMTTAIIYLAR